MVKIVIYALARENETCDGTHPPTTGLYEWLEDDVY
jgi:hypothetical protein